MGSFGAVWEAEQCQPYTSSKGVSHSLSDSEAKRVNMGLLGEIPNGTSCKLARVLKEPEKETDVFYST